MKLRSWVIKVRGGSRIILKSHLDDRETDFLGSLKSSKEYQRSPVESLPLKVNIEIPSRKMFAGTSANKNDIKYSNIFLGEYFKFAFFINC